MGLAANVINSGMYSLEDINYIIDDYIPYDRLK